MDHERMDSIRALVSAFRKMLRFRSRALGRRRRASHGSELRANPRSDELIGD